MTDTFNFEESLRYMKKGSLVGLLIVVVILFFSYYDFFKYFRIETNSVFVFLCWAYLFFNIGIANIIKYVNERHNPECPKCHKKLTAESYKCKNCGKLKFNKNKK